MPKIVISYRRADSAAIAGRIFDRLTQRYGEESVFMDVDNIPVGIDFRHHIRHVLETSDVFLAVVGLRWAGEGGARIRQDADPVRVEVETALQRALPIIPVLVDGASMPDPAELPDSLRDFAYINAAVVDTGRDFRQHAERLFRIIDGLTGDASARTHLPFQPTVSAAAMAPGSPGVARRWRGWLFAALALLPLAAGAWFLAPAGFLRGSAPVPQQQQPEPAAASGGPVVSAPAEPAPVAPPAAAPVAPTAPAPVAPPAPPPITYRVLANVSTGVQNMRTGPATKYPIVVAVPAGATGITLSSCRASEDGTRPWCAVRWRTHAGWISSCCIVDENTGKPPPVAELSERGR